MTGIEIIILAMVLDGLIGDPQTLWQKIPHPAALMGRMVALAETHLNQGRNRRLKGVIAIGLLLAAAMLAGWVLLMVPDDGVLETLVVAILLAQNSLATHVKNVARALEKGLAQARRSVALIVGRDAEQLDETGIIRGAIESAAENFSDGVLAPVFWYLVAGLPGIMAYKMVNTADSMIGYRTERFEAFGWASARLDDVANWIPARVSGGLICLVHGSTRAMRVMAKDARLHRSPNAGWPEAALAGVLNIALSGPRAYHGKKTTDPYVNANGRHDLSAADIDAAVRVIWRSWAGLLGLLILWGWIL